LIISDSLDVDEILGLHAYFGGTLPSGVTSAISAVLPISNDPKKWTAGRRIRFSAGWELC